MIFCVSYVHTQAVPYTIWHEY